MSDVYDVIVEITYMSNVKYEINDQNHLCVDRVLSTPMMYPGNYGYIPGTLTDDGDPVDVLIINTTPFLPKSYVKCRILGMLETEDEKGLDPKVIAIPIHKIENTYDQLRDINDVHVNTLQYILHFFKYYKGNEKEKWVKIGDYKNKEETINMIKKSFINQT